MKKISLLLSLISLSSLFCYSQNDTTGTIECTTQLKSLLADYIHFPDSIKSSPRKALAIVEFTISKGKVEGVNTWQRKDNAISFAIGKIVIDFWNKQQFSKNLSTKIYIPYCLWIADGIVERKGMELSGLFDFPFWIQEKKVDPSYSVASPILNILPTKSYLQSRKDLEKNSNND